MRLPTIQEVRARNLGTPTLPNRSGIQRLRPRSWSQARRHRAASLLAATCLTVAAVAASPLIAGTAAAASTCSGKQINHRNVIAKDNVKIGEVRLFWNSSTGKNCVITVKQGRTYGFKSITRASLTRCENKSGTYCLDQVDETNPVDNLVDDGVYSYYAGPVSVWAKGYCVQWWGDIQDTDGHVYQAFVGSSNCGS